MSRRLVRPAAVALGLLALVGITFAAPPAQPRDGVLVGPTGMTLYTFDKDAVGAGKSACNGPCATLWPPLAADASAQPEGDWTVVTRDDGSRQWAYKGKPLYHYQADKAAGDRLGDNFRDVWHVAR